MYIPQPPDANSPVIVFKMSPNMTNPSAPKPPTFSKMEYSIPMTQIGRTIIEDMLAVADSCDVPRYHSTKVASIEATRHTGMPWDELLRPAWDDIDYN